MSTHHHRTLLPIGARAAARHRQNVVSIARARRRRWTRHLALAILAFVSGTTLDDIPNARTKTHLEHRRSVKVKRNA